MHRVRTRAEFSDHLWGTRTHARFAGNVALDRAATAVAAATTYARGPSTLADRNDTLLALDDAGEALAHATSQLTSLQLDAVEAHSSPFYRTDDSRKLRDARHSLRQDITEAERELDAAEAKLIAGDRAVRDVPTRTCSENAADAFDLLGDAEAEMARARFAASQYRDAARQTFDGVRANSAEARMRRVVTTTTVIEGVRLLTHAGRVRQTQPMSSRPPWDLDVPPQPGEPARFVTSLFDDQANTLYTIERETIVDVEAGDALLANAREKRAGRAHLDFDRPLSARSTSTRTSRRSNESTRGGRLLPGA
jgi:hypothetical protein